VGILLFFRSHFLSIPGPARNPSDQDLPSGIDAGLNSPDRHSCPQETHHKKFAPGLWGDLLSGDEEGIGQGSPGTLRQEPGRLFRSIEPAGSHSRYRDHAGDGKSRGGPGKRKGRHSPWGPYR